MLRSRMNLAAKIAEQAESLEAEPERQVSGAPLSFATAPELVAEVAADEPRSLPPAIARLKDVVHERIIDDFDQSQLAELDSEAARQLLRRAASEILALQNVQGLGAYREALLEEIVDDVLGLGPLE